MTVDNPAVDDLAVIGRITKAHGLRGEFIVRPSADGSDVLLHLERLTLDHGGRRFAVEVRTAKLHSGQILLSLEGYADRTAAETLQGAEILVRTSELPPPDPGEFYRQQLIGLRVVSPAGEALGTVVDLESSPVQEWLVVEGPQGRSLVPFTEPLVQIDLPGGKVVVDAPEGLFDVERLK